MTPLDIPEQYTLPVKREDWSALLVDWKPLLPASFVPWLLTKFGELFLEQEDRKVGVLKVSSFQYQVVAKDTIDFREWLADPDKMSEWFLAPLVDGLESSGKILGPDQCYSFVRALGLGGALGIDNVAILSLPKHFCGWGKVFRQMAGVPPGTEIVLKR